MKFLNMMRKFHTRQEEAPSPEAGGGGGLTPPPMPAPTVPAPTPAPAPAPVVPAPQPAPTPAPVLPVEPQQQVSALENYVAQAGLTAEHIQQEMSAFGELSDVTKAMLRNKHGEHAELIISALKQEHAQFQSEMKAAQQQTYDELATLLGVDSNQASTEFGTMIEWLATSEYKGQGAELADLIDAGGLGRTLALQALTMNYRAANTGANLISGEPPAPSNNGALTIAEYNKQLHELTQQYGYNSPQVKALQQRRNAARQAGIN